MDFLLCTIGSHGDVHPFVGIGRALQARGHSVTVIVNGAFEKLVRKAGLNYAPLGTEEEFRAIQENPELWHAMRGPQTVLREIGRTLPVLFDSVRDLAKPGTVVVGSTLALGARIASEKLGLPMATVHLAPLCIRSSVRMPVLPGGFDSNWIPGFLRKQFWAGADRWFVDPHIMPAVNTFRAEHGLAAVDRLQEGWWHAPHLTIGLWPDWFFPRQADYPEQVRLAGFPLYDESDHNALDAELAAWIAAGPAPIAFTPGSAMLHGHAFFAAAVDACQRLNRRGLLLTRHGEQIPKNLPTGVRHVPFAPFGSLLPGCAAIVHHGGIGTTAQSLRAGIPQLIMPMSHDQFDNAAICRRLGVADSISVRRFTGKRVAAKLSALLDAPERQSACQHVAALSSGDMPLQRVCELLERIENPQKPAEIAAP
ncbi:MAG: glycosyltransferase [Tepidisphaeraceae bacterium]